MDERVKRLVAVGASVGANCHPCIEYHVGKALEQGIGKEELLEAVEMAKAVRKGAAASMDKLVIKLLDSCKSEECGDQKSPCCCS